MTTGVRTLAGPCATCDLTVPRDHGVTFGFPEVEILWVLLELIMNFPDSPCLEDVIPSTETLKVDLLCDELVLLAAQLSLYHNTNQ